MRIFVGWPYDVTWVREKIVPLIESYGVEVLTGEEVFGEKLNEAVKKRILAADATIFVAARRSQTNDGWATSDWVVSEIHYAKAWEKKHILEIRERGVEYPDKLDDTRQYVIIEPGAVADAMLACGKAVGSWKGLTFKLKLGPEDFVKDLRTQRSSKCTYKLRQDGTVIDEGTAEIVREGQGLFVYLRDLRTVANTYLELSVERWSSTGVQLSALEVEMERI